MASPLLPWIISALYQALGLGPPELPRYSLGRENLSTRNACPSHHKAPEGGVAESKIKLRKKKNPNEGV
jgi:hypothetical protein